MNNSKQRISFALLFFSLFCIAKGLSYHPAVNLTKVTSVRVVNASETLGVYTWLTLWVVVGFISLLSALFIKRTRNLSWSAGVGLTVAWGSTYFFSSFLSHTPISESLYDLSLATEYITLGIVIGILSHYSSKQDKIEEIVQSK